MSNAISGLISILLEIETYNESQIPPYRHEEVAAAELALASARVDYRALLLHHRMSIEKSVENINRLSLSDMAGSDHEVPNKESDKAAAAELNRQNLARERLQLERLTERTIPDVALTVLTSRFQQLQRGLTIYKYKRALKIVNLAFDLCLANRELDETIAAKLNVTEQQLLSTVRKLLAEAGLYNKMRDLPEGPNSDRSRAWLEPPVWLVETSELLMKGIENVSDQNQALELRLMAKALLEARSNVKFDFSEVLPDVKI